MGERLKLSQASEGQVVWLDGGFTCACPGPVRLRARDDGALYFDCDEGSHDLVWQADDGENCVGVFTSQAAADAHEAAVVKRGDAYILMAAASFSVAIVLASLAHHLGWF